MIDIQCFIKYIFILYQTHLYIGKHYTKLLYVEKEADAREIELRSIFVVQHDYGGFNYKTLSQLWGPIDRGKRFLSGLWPKIKRCCVNS